MKKVKIQQANNHGVTETTKPGPLPEPDPAPRPELIEKTNASV